MTFQKMISPFNMRLTNYQRRVEAALNKFLPNNHTQLTQAMRYSALNGGKRLRAALTYASAESLNIDNDAIDYAAVAVECIHAYSLIHDDLPAMDDDDLRRGKPSCHKAYNEAEAILAGDALNTLAFELLTQSPLTDSIKIVQINCLAKAAGCAGMVGGQSLDIAYTGKPISLETLKTIHQRKTGALIQAALIIGALPSKNYQNYQTIFTKLGENLGIAYQIIDDVLDATADTATLGKTADKDAEQGKNTYYQHLGLEECRHLIHLLHQESEVLIEQLPFSLPLKEILEILFNRVY